MMNRLQTRLLRRQSRSDDIDPEHGQRLMIAAVLRILAALRLVIDRNVPTGTLQRFVATVRNDVVSGHCEMMRVLPVGEGPCTCFERRYELFQRLFGLEMHSCYPSAREDRRRHKASPRARFAASRR